MAAALVTVIALRDSLADQRARFVGCSFRDNAEFNPRRIAVERRSVTSLRP